MTTQRKDGSYIFYILILIAAAIALGRPAPSVAQQVERDRDNLRITAIDTDTFPTVGVRVLTTTKASAPIEDLTRLVLRENGVTISERSAFRTPVGIDLALVVDANAGILLIDNRDGISRRDKVVASINDYATRFMSPAGLDRVSIIVPDETGKEAAFLIKDATRSVELASVIDAWEPTPPNVTPLQSMLSEALDHLARGDERRFRAILLFTDAGRINQQLDYQLLVDAAQVAHVPIYAAILGVEASADEIDNVARLYSPTNGAYVHMPVPEATDPLYDIFRRQSFQAELTYRSDVRQNGTQEVSVSLGNVRDTARFELSLAAPEAFLEAQQVNVRRAGSAVDTPLPLLQPAILPLTVHLDWPDGRPRLLSDFSFRVDGVPQTLPSEPVLDGSGQIHITWDISERDTGSYLLEVAITDSLGFQVVTEPLTIAIEAVRPIAPTPTPVPTRVPPPTLKERIDTPLFQLVVPFAAIALAGLLMWMARRRRARAGKAPAPPEPQTTPPPPPFADGRHVAVLVWADDQIGTDRIDLIPDDVTLGRDPHNVDVVVDDPTVSRLHARIRRNAAGEYWLFDEGSIEGTFLNYDRLGLAPRRLHHNDTLQLGRVSLRFRLELPGTYDDPAAQRSEDSESEYSVGE